MNRALVVMQYLPGCIGARMCGLLSGFRVICPGVHPAWLSRVVPLYAGSALTCASGEFLFA